MMVKVGAARAAPVYSEDSSIMGQLSCKKRATDIYQQ